MSRVGERADPRGLPPGLAGLCGALIAIGLASFGYGLVSDPATAWRAFHVNFVYYAALSQGGLCLACAMVIIGATWAGPVRHVAAALAAWVPVTLLLAAVGILGQEYVFQNWIHGAPYPKGSWLTQTRVNETDLAILAVMTALSLAFLRASLRPALRGAAERATWASGCSRASRATGRATTRSARPRSASCACWLRSSAWATSSATRCLASTR